MFAEYAILLFLEEVDEERVEENSEFRVDEQRRVTSPCFLVSLQKNSCFAWFLDGDDRWMMMMGDNVSRCVALCYFPPIN